MRTSSRRTLWVLLAGAVLTGWCSASIVSPPSVGTQTLPRRAGASAEITVPTLVLATAVPHIPPLSRRNPFAFGDERSVERQVGTSAVAPRDASAPGALEEAAGPPPQQEPEIVWRLIGMATSDLGQTAILAGPMGVRLVRLDDRLPDGRTVLDLNESSVTLGGGSGPPVVLRLP